MNEEINSRHAANTIKAADKNSSFQDMLTKASVSKERLEIMRIIKEVKHEKNN